MKKNKAKPLPSAAEIASEFYYDDNLGVLRYLSGPRAGFIAGSRQSAGYMCVRMNNERYLLHRLVWKLHKNTEPEEIDHKNNNRNDSRIENLREASPKKNRQNMSKPKNNTSGLKGAYFRKYDQRWFSRIGNNGKSIFLGYFSSAEEAHLAYQKAAENLYGEFANFGGNRD